MNVKSSFFRPGLNLNLQPTLIYDEVKVEYCVSLVVDELVDFGVVERRVDLPDEQRRGGVMAAAAADLRG